MLSNIFLVIAVIALGFMLVIAVNGLLKGGLKGIMNNSKGVGISFLIYLVAFVIFLITQ